MGHKAGPSPSHHPVFDCLQYTKWMGEGVGAFIMQVMSMSAYVERNGKVGGEREAAGVELRNSFC